MSRLAKNPIPLPEGVKVEKKEQQIICKGPKGLLHLQVPVALEIASQNTELRIVENDQVSSRERGLYFSLIRNMVQGVSVGFQKTLTLVGIGYKAAVNGENLDLQLGFSHIVSLPVPKSLQVQVEKNTTIVISGTDKQLVGQFAAYVRGLKKIDPYKGKGILYIKDGKVEHIRRKAGKSAKK